MQSDHTEIRLEKNGEVVAYFAPNFEVQPTADNDLEPGGGMAMPHGRPPRVRDFRKIMEEVTVQGQFHDTHDPETGTPALPADHISDLQTAFGKEVVTARDQVRRIRHFMHEVGGPFELYEGDDEYTAGHAGAVDWENGTFPVVQISQFRPPQMGGHSRFEYTVQMVVGVPRGTEEDDEGGWW